MADDWRKRARAEIAAIRPFWRDQYGWSPRVEEREDSVDLYIRFTRWPSDGSPLHVYLLRLRYLADFETAGRREAFVNPEKPEELGPEFWPPGRPFKTDKFQICLEGTYGFHSALHRERDGRKANLNRLLIEIQKVLNP